LCIYAHLDYLPSPAVGKLKNSILSSITFMCASAGMLSINVF
jgi:hypothetical protein